MPGLSGLSAAALARQPPHPWPAPAPAPAPAREVSTAASGAIAKAWSPTCLVRPEGSAGARVPVSTVASPAQQLHGSQTATRHIDPSLLDAHGSRRPPILRRGRHFLPHLEQVGRYFSGKFSCGPGRWNHLPTGASREHRISYNCCLWRQHPASCSRPRRSPAILPGNQQETQLPEMVNQSRVSHNLCLQHSRG